MEPVSTLRPIGPDGPHDRTFGPHAVPRGDRERGDGRMSCTSRYVANAPTRGRRSSRARFEISSSPMTATLVRKPFRPAVRPEQGRLNRSPQPNSCRSPAADRRLPELDRTWHRCWSQAIAVTVVGIPMARRRFYRSGRRTVLRCRRLTSMVGGHHAGERTRVSPAEAVRRPLPDAIHPTPHATRWPCISGGSFLGKTGLVKKFGLQYLFQNSRYR